MTILNGKPVYQRITNDIKNKIHKGEMKPSDLLPSENTLAQAYDTSRVTVRKSLQLLEHDGYIYSWPGKGYFVSQPRHDVFTFVYNELGSMHNIDYKEITVIMPDEKIQNAMNLLSQQQVIRLCRVIKQDNEPVALDYKYLLYDKGTPLVEVEMRYAAFPEIVAEKATPFAFHTRMEISAEIANENLMKKLRCTENTALLLIKRYFIDQHDKCIGYGETYTLPAYGCICAQSGYEKD